MASVVKEGYLTKEGGSVKSWKKRWCVLRSDGTLTYSKQKSDKPIDSLKVKDAQGPIRATSENKKKEFVFEFPQPNRIYFFSASSQNEMDDWLKLLRSCKESVTGGGGGDTSKAASGGGSPTKGEAATKKVGVDDFELMNVIGRGSFGKVMQVKLKATGQIFAMKILNKKSVVERGELEHTKSEKQILQKLDCPFLVNLNYSFQTPDKLYFIMDFVNGGELFHHLQNERRFDENRVRFYAAEIVLGLEYLHKMGILYRDLKPENILLTANGHICLTDFGISKQGLVAKDARTATFCGTPEYLAPEVLEGNGYGKAVDWWSFGTLVYEMLTGMPPFYATDVQQMYAKIMSDPLKPAKGASAEGMDLLEQLLIRDPEKRLADPAEIKAHPFFSGIDWEKLARLEVTPPFNPNVKDKSDVGQIDKEFTDEPVQLTYADASKISSSVQENFQGFTYVSSEGGILEGDKSNN